MALIAAALSYKGTAPAPRIALAVNTFQDGWVILPTLDEPIKVLAPEEAEQLITAFDSQDESYWQIISANNNEENSLTWLLAGTHSDWSGTPIGLAVLLEEDNPKLAEEIARNLLGMAP